jgi:hypothetical protein
MRVCHFILKLFGNVRISPLFYTVPPPGDLQVRKPGAGQQPYGGAQKGLIQQVAATWTGEAYEEVW